MDTPKTYRAGIAGLMLVAAVAATAALPAWTSPTIGAETVGEPAPRMERARALKVVGHRLGAELPEGLRVSALGSRSPVKLTRPLSLMFDDANRIAGWIESLQRSVHHHMGDAIEAVSLVDVTEAEAATRPFAFAIGERWFAVDHVQLRHSGRTDLSRPGPIADLAAQTACRFMSRLAATPSAPERCAGDPASTVRVASR